ASRLCYHDAAEKAHPTYSMTSSVRASSIGGTREPPFSGLCQLPPAADMLPHEAMCENAQQRPSPPSAHFQSREMPAAFIGTAHFWMSLSTSLCRYSGDRRSGVTRVAARGCTFSCTEGVFIASFVASPRRRTTGSGAPLGMKKAYQSLTSNPVSPCS